MHSHLQFHNVTTVLWLPLRVPKQNSRIVSLYTNVKWKRRFTCRLNFFLLEEASQTPRFLRDDLSITKREDVTRPTIRHPTARALRSFAKRTSNGNRVHAPNCATIEQVAPRLAVNREVSSPHSVRIHVRTLTRLSRLNADFARGAFTSLTKISPAPRSRGLFSTICIVGPRPWYISTLIIRYKLAKWKKKKKERIMQMRREKLRYTLAIVSLMPRAKLAISRQRAMKDLWACPKFVAARNSSSFDCIIMHRC